MTGQDTQSEAALLKALLDATISDAIVVADAKGIILKVIPTTVQMFGYGADALIGHDIKKLMTPQDSDRHDGYMRRYLETGASQVIGKGREVVGRHADGTLIPLNVSLGTTSLHGAPIFVAIMHDLTERKRRESDLAQARKMETIAKLTGGFAHDFNNLLTIAMGNLELLEAEIKGDSQREMLQDALSALELGSELTARLLAFARRSPLAPEHIDPNAAVRRTMQLLRRTIGTRVKIRFVPGGNVPAIRADPVQFQSALLNIAVNAQDAMPDGGTLAFETLAVSFDDPVAASQVGLEVGDYVRIRVSDTGHGMDSDAVSQAFEPFFSTKASGQGTGLGLSMVYGFMGQSNGQASIDSSPGKGTTVNLYFPAAEQPPVAEGHEDAQAEAKGAGETILVVEDDDALRALTLAHVTALGYKALDAENADEALRIIEAGPRPALVLSDVVMPGTMNGYELALHLSGTMPDVRVLLTSGYSQQTLDQSGNATRFPLLVKPFSRADLAAMLNKVIGGG